ncbi:tetratricopeptide repeat protein [Lentisalinibacter orientalis]|uniref:tetratricopeptide repeat protein n=1 Tax=Lentisalinibacter orientalis TaxID=2992241 RepID=UPI00386D1CD8
MRLLLFVLLFGLSACANLPFEPSPSPTAGDPASVPSEQEEPETRSGSAEAVRELVANSREYRADGDYSRALADIERAIRIEPRNPYLWLELGETHLIRDDPRQAAATARKAMSVAGSDGAAKAAAEELLERASRR